MPWLKTTFEKRLDSALIVIQMYTTLVLLHEPKLIFGLTNFFLFLPFLKILGAQRLTWPLLLREARFLLATKNVFMITSNCHNTTK